MSRIVLAMSGGVDSSVAAHLLLSAGHEVIGIFMRHGEQSPVACDTGSGGAGLELPIVDRLDHQQGCCTAADADDARRVADRLGIPFYALNLQEEFARIIDYFVEEYTIGRTPNPCVECNNWIKFGKLFDYADSVGAEYVATGHYARLAGQGDAVQLHRGVDATKDQSYVLFGIRRSLLGRMLLPVGNFQKTAIRAMASELGMRVADKRDSQEICFVTRGRYDAFVRSKRKDVTTAGELVTTDGTVVGQHEGIEQFTIGQRKGLGVAFGEPRFVVRIEPDTRRVVLGHREELGRRELSAGKANWLEPEVERTVGETLGCYAQIRYNTQAAPARLTVLPDRRLKLFFDEPQFGVAPGQAVVCYDAEQNLRVLGGAWIE